MACTVALGASVPAALAAPQMIGSAKPTAADGTATDASYQTFFDSNISSTDLLQTAVAGTPVTTGSASGGSFGGLYDGAASSKPYNGDTNDLSHDTFFSNVSLAASPSITFTFTSPQTIASIRSISGWGDTPTFGNQDYSIYLNGSTTAFYSVAYNPLTTDTSLDGNSNNNRGLNPNSTQVLVNDDAGGPLATNVSSIEFVFTANSSSNGAVYRELDVNTVPEPATLGLLGMASLVCLSRRRR